MDFLLESLYLFIGKGQPSHARTCHVAIQDYYYLKSRTFFFLVCVGEKAREKGAMKAY